MYVEETDGAVAVEAVGCTSEEGVCVCMCVCVYMCVYVCIRVCVYAELEIRIRNWSAIQ